MQHKLATWATADPNRRFDRLFRLITHPVWLSEAARITLASSGARTPGVDGMCGDDIQADLDMKIRELSAALRDGRFVPSPARRVYIPKTNGKKRPLGIPTLFDRIVQRAMLMVMDPIWESDFSHFSYGFRPERSVHHAIRTVKLQLQDSGKWTKGRWVVEGDLANYFDTVHHQKLMGCVRKRVRDKRFENLLWQFLKAGHVDKGLFRAASDGVPQGGVLSPLLSNIMLHEFDSWLLEQHASPKARSNRQYWNKTIQNQTAAAVREGRQWKPAVSFCRYADDFILIVKGTKSDAEAIKEECRAFLEGKLSLRLNMDKTHITHVNDGFVFLGHRLIRKRNGRGRMSVVSTIPHDRARAFRKKLCAFVSTDYSANPIDKIGQLNAMLRGWGGFYQFTDHKAYVFRKIDHSIFWKLAHWLGRKYRSRIKELMRKWFRAPLPDMTKTWSIYMRSGSGEAKGANLYRLVGNASGRFNWLNPSQNPYVLKDEKPTRTSGYGDVALAMGQS